MRTLIQRPPRPTPRPVTGVPACGEGPRQKHRAPALRVSRFLSCRYQAAARAQGRLLRRGVLPQLEDSAAAHEARNVGAAHLGRGVRCRCCHKSRPRLSARRYPGGPRAADGPSTSLWRPDRLRPQEIRPSLLRAQAPPPPATTTRSGTSLAMCSLAVALVAAALVPASHPCRRAQSTRSSSLGNAAQPHSLLALRRPPPTAGVSSPRTREQPCLASPWPRADAGAPQGLQPAPRQRRMSRQLQGATQPAQARSAARTAARIEGRGHFFARFKALGAMVLSGPLLCALPPPLTPTHPNPTHAPPTPLPKSPRARRLLAASFAEGRCGFTQTCNDWFDRDLDAINEPYRPIPSGAISQNEVNRRLNAANARAAARAARAARAAAALAAAATVSAPATPCAAARAVQLAPGLGVGEARRRTRAGGPNPRHRLALFVAAPARGHDLDQFSRGWRGLAADGQQQRRGRRRRTATADDGTLRAARAAGAGALPRGARVHTARAAPTARANRHLGSRCAEIVRPFVEHRWRRASDRFVPPRWRSGHAPRPPAWRAADGSRPHRRASTHADRQEG